MSFPLAIIAGLAVPAVGTVNAWKSGGLQGGVGFLASSLSGYNPITGQWQAANLKQGAVPIGVGFLVHWIAGRLGVNRAIARAGIPFIRI